MLSIIIFIVSFLSVFLNPITVTTTSNNLDKMTHIGYSLCPISNFSCVHDISIQIKKNQINDEKLINAILEKIDSGKLKNWLFNLSSFHNRHTKTEYIDQVAYWIKNELQQTCNGKVYFYNFNHLDQEKNYQLKNIICDISSWKSNVKNSTIIISAHYDDRMEALNNTKARAPGADDNASGVSALLEVARILSNINLQNNIQIVFFSGEEQGQWGSKSYVKALHTNNTKIDLLVNLDMIGFPPPSELNKEYVIIEYDEWNKVPTNNIDSKKTAEFMKQIALHYTNLIPRLQNLSNSDFNPFEALGYTVIGLHDGGEKYNPHYHKSSDSPDTIDIEYLAAITKLTLATILKLNTNLK